MSFPQAIGYAALTFTWTLFFMSMAMGVFSKYFIVDFNQDRRKGFVMFIIGSAILSSLAVFLILI